jgi:hypothetical protein
MRVHEARLLVDVDGNGEAVAVVEVRPPDDAKGAPVPH